MHGNESRNPQSIQYGSSWPCGAFCADCSMFALQGTSSYLEARGTNQQEWARAVVARASPDCAIQTCVIEGIRRYRPRKTRRRSGIQQKIGAGVVLRVVCFHTTRQGTGFTEPILQLVRCVRWDLLVARSWTMLVGWDGQRLVWLMGIGRALSVISSRSGGFN
jgi:hypothetical protein